jgi:hypothetical protein
MVRNTSNDSGNYRDKFVTRLKARSIGSDFAAYSIGIFYGGTGSIVMSKKSHKGCNNRFGPLDLRSLEFDPPLSMRLS